MKMKTNSAGLKIIKESEGLRLKAYKCPAGVWTIGYGHTKGVREGDVITEEEAEELLQKDLEITEHFITRIASRLKKPIDGNQFSALVSFVYNIGTGAFKRSTLYTLLLNNPDDADIHQEFNKWVYVNHVVMPGLVTRRQKEADLYFEEEEIEYNPPYTLPKKSQNSEQYYNQG
jgi:lysozyme